MQQQSTRSTTVLPERAVHEALASARAGHLSALESLATLTRPTGDLEAAVSAAAWAADSLYCAAGGLTDRTPVGQTVMELPTERVEEARDAVLEGRRAVLEALARLAHPAEDTDDLQDQAREDLATAADHLTIATCELELLVALGAEVAAGEPPAAGPAAPAPASQEVAPNAGLHLETYAQELTEGLLATLAGVRRIQFESIGDAEELLAGFQKVAWVAEHLTSDARAASAEIR